MKCNKQQQDYSVGASNLTSRTEEMAFMTRPFIHNFVCVSLLLGLFIVEMAEWSQFHSMHCADVHHKSRRAELH